MNHSVKLGRPGEAAARALLARILDRARDRGIDQKTLAARAGISPESLSRSKRMGGCRLTTALELAWAAGFTTLDLVESARPRAAASIAARKLGAGRRLPISAADLVTELSAAQPSKQHRVHVTGFFEELPIEMVHDVVLDEELDYVRLLALAHRIGAEGETVDWLAEMAGDRVAHAA